MTTKRRTERRVSRALKEWVRTGGKATGFPKGRRDSDWISVRLRRNPSGRTQIALDRRETERLFRSIELGDRVSVLDMHGHVHTGRAVQLGPGGWKLNIGYPAWRTATHLNVVAVKKPARAARTTGRRANPRGSGSVEYFRPRFIAPGLLTELSNLWHTSRTAANTRYDRMIWTSKWFAKEHPEYTSTAVYKDLDAYLAFGGR